MASKRSYVTFAADGSLADASSKSASPAPASTSDVVYRLGRIAEEVRGRLSGAGSRSVPSPNAASAGSLSAYTFAPEGSGGAKGVGADAVPVDEDAPVALVMVRGKDARAVIQGVASAGMRAVVPYTRDRKAASYLRFAQGTVCLGERYSDALFSNAYAVLEAARACGASVVFLCDEAMALARVDAFLACAQDRSLAVFSALDPASPALGWTPCATERELAGEESWCTCRACGLSFEESSLAKSSYVCPSCSTYFRLTSSQRIDDLLDMGSFEEWDAVSAQSDPLQFPGYGDKIAKQRDKTGFDEAVRTGRGKIAGLDCALGVMDSTFFMGSMGHVVGEKLARMVDRACGERLPVIIFCASGGARMQEGLVSLMQMAKVSCALERLGRARLPYFSVLTDPTTGGVTASFALQGDVILAEPGALIGFAGKRVIQDTIRQELPEGFQTAEFALEHGLIDAVVARSDLRATLAHLIAIHRATLHSSRRREGFDAALASAGVESGVRAAPSGADGIMLSYDCVCRTLESGRATYNHVTFGSVPLIDDGEAREQEASIAQTLVKLVGQGVSSAATAHRARAARKVASLDAEDGSSLVAQGPGSPNDAATPSDEAASLSSDAWESVQLARNTHRPTARFYIDRLFEGFIELHGDRSFGDDGAVVAGVGWLGGQVVTVIAQEKGADLKERVRRNFGCPQPEGYRKSLRLMRQAEKFDRPIVCLVDTQGAFCGAEAEERGQGNAIADNLIAMAGLRVPVVSVLLGEGGSGGALALAVSNRVAMQEHAVYSVLSPEGFASILWKDRARAFEAAAVMRMGARQVHAMGIVDAVIPEGPGAAHENPERAAAEVRAYVEETLEELSALSADELVAQRHERFARF